MISELVYLTQTDTTVGFLSRSSTRLAQIKGRHPKQPFLCCVDSFQKQKQLSRTPKKFRNLVRRSTKTTFLYPNKKAIRMVRDTQHKALLKPFDFLYSTSANPHKHAFNHDFAIQHADVIIEDKEGFSQKPPSLFVKLGSKRRKKIR